MCEVFYLLLSLVEGYVDIWTDIFFANQFREVVMLNNFLRSRNIKGRKERVVYSGNSSEYPTGSNAASYASYITEELGIPMCTLEHSDFIFDKALGTSAAMTRAVELYLNHIALALDFYKK